MKMQGVKMTYQIAGRKITCHDNARQSRSRGIVLFYPAISCHPFSVIPSYSLYLTFWMSRTVPSTKAMLNGPRGSKGSHTNMMTPPKTIPAMSEAR